MPMLVYTHVKRFHSSDIPGFPGPLGVIFRIHPGRGATKFDRSDCPRE
jgi:hypothetical protein